MRFLLLIIALIGLAASVRMVDDFTIAQTGVKSSFVGVSASGAVTGPNANILGGERDLVATLIRDNTATTEDGVELFVSSFLQALKYSVDTANRGIGEVQWDGSDGGSDVFSTTGLGGIDLTADGDNAFGWIWLSSDIPANVTIEVRDMNGGVSILPYYNPGSYVADFVTTNLRLTFPYYAFIGNADFTNVGALRIKFESPGEVDLEVGRFFTERMLSETKTQSVSSGQPGDIVTYTIFIQNPDDDYDAPANEITVNDYIDDGLVLVTGTVVVTRNGQPDPNIIVTNGNAPGNEDVEVVILSLEDGGNVTISFQARFLGDMACPPAPIPNFATVDIAGSPRDTNTVTATVTGFTTLNVTTSVTDRTYTLTTCNTGNQLATDVTVTATVPAQVAGVSNGNFTCQSGVCTAVVGSIRAGICRSLTLTYTVVSTPCGVTNVTPVFTVTQTCGGPSQVSANGPTFQINGQSVVQVTMNATASANAGSVSVVTVCARNVGNSNSPGADITLNYNTMVVTPLPNESARCSFGVCSFRISNLNAGGPQQCLPVSFNVASPLLCNQTIANFNATAVDVCTQNSTNLSSSTVLVAPVALTLTKTFAGSGAVIPGGLIPFDLVVCNLGRRVATNVILTDTYATFMTPQGTNCTNGVCTYTLGSIVPGNATCVTRRVTYRLDAEVPCVFANPPLPATVREDCQAQTDTASATFEVNAAVFLTIDKVEVGGNSVRPGQQLNYTITVTNTGNRIANQLVITERASNYTTPVAAQQGWSCSNGVCTYSIATLAPSQGPVDVTFRVTVNSPVPANIDEITNVATVVSSVNCPANASTTENTDLLANPDVVITKTLMNDPPLQAGSEAVFEFTYWNLGDVTAEGVQIIDTMPQYMSMMNVTTNQGWSCVNKVCTYTVGSVEPSSVPTSVFMTVLVDTPLACNVLEAVNNVEIIDDGTQGEDTDLSNNQDSETVTFIGTTDISVTLVTSTPIVRAGEQACFTAVINSNGNRDASNVQVAFTVPGYTTPASVGYSCSNGNCTSTTLVPSFSSRDGERSYFYCVLVDSSLPSTVNSASTTVTVIESCQLRTDSATVSVQLLAAPDLKVCKSGRVTSLAYDVDVVNNGSREALNVRLEESVPAGTTFNAAASDPRWSCDAQGSCVVEIDRLAVGDFDTAYFVVDMVVEIDTCTPFQNIATASLSNGPELDDTNNLDAITFSVCEGTSCPGQVAPAECICNVAAPIIQECICNCSTPEVVECTNVVCEESTCATCEEPGNDETVINLEFGAISSTCPQ